MVLRLLQFLSALAVPAAQLLSLGEMLPSFLDAQHLTPYKNWANKTASISKWSLEVKTELFSEPW